MAVDLAVSPNGRPMDASPLAKPGYHGGRKLSDYERGIAHALMRRGIQPKSRAIAMARGLLKKANRTGRWGDHGVAHAATRAGAAASIVQRKSFAVQGSEADIRLVREGSIRSGPHRGKYPVANAHQARSAVKLASHGKGISRAKVLAHVRSECKKRGIPVPKGAQLAVEVEHEMLLDLATAVVHRYRHGWVPIGPADERVKADLRPKSRKDKSTGRRKNRAPKGRARAAAERARAAAMHEAARRQLAIVGLRGPGKPANITVHTGGQSGEGKFRLTGGILSGGLYSQFSQVMRDQCLAELSGRGLIDLASWKPELHPRVPFGKGGGRFTRKLHAPNRDQVTSERYRAHVTKVDNYLTRHVQTHASESKYASGTHPDGSIDWTPERHEMHQRLVKMEFDRQVAAGAKRERKAIFLGGLPGAGKTQGMRRTLGDVESNYITVNPDTFKERMAHMGLIDKHPGLSPLEASGFHHEETATMAEMLAKHAMERGYNIIHDITMNNSKSVTKRLEPLKSRGYQATAMFFDIPHEFSQHSVEARHRRGWEMAVANPGHVGQRLVPSSHVASGKSKKGSTSANRDAFDETKHLFDGYKLFWQGGMGSDGRGQYLMRLKEHKNPGLLESR
jgi:Zeta toxin